MCLTGRALDRLMKVLIREKGDEMRLLLVVSALITANSAIASTVPPPTSVPEIGAIGVTAAIAGVGAVVALVRERRGRRD